MEILKGSYRSVLVVLLLIFCSRSNELSLWIGGSFSFLGFLLYVFSRSSRQGVQALVNPGVQFTAMSRFVRYPLFLSYFLIGTGLLLATAKAYVFCFGFLALALFLKKKMQGEEALRREFGSVPYLLFSQEVSPIFPRFIPYPTLSNISFYDPKKRRLSFRKKDLLFFALLVSTFALLYLRSSYA
ncbi:MAG: hypothetical protein KA436_09355 [Oligoflexales bacterium]|nr:hypothetical protein [Oligoflexales bacterium]